MPVLGAERVYVYLSIAQYAAIDEADKQSFADATLLENDFGPGGRSRFEGERGAVSGASAAVLGFFFPSQASAFQQLVDSEATARGSTHPHFEAGLAAGREVAQAIITRAQNDRFTVPFTGTIPTGAGFWIAAGTPIGGTGAGVLPFVLTSADQFRPPPPPAFGSSLFAADLAEIRQLSNTRTPEQLAIARAWAYPGGTFTPAGHWNQLAARYIAEHNLNERGAAHVFALMHAAQYDSHVIACSDAKYTYWYIRPSQADAAITLPIGLPNHPSYPSGHTCASSAATTVLAHFFPERAAELTAQRTEAGLSRMYGGLHYRFDITAAAQLGTSIAQRAIMLDQTQGLLSVLH
jgi:membrane-associated phospholipid phosphatase